MRKKPQIDADKIFGEALGKGSEQPETTEAKPTSQYTPERSKRGEGRRRVVRSFSIHEEVLDRLTRAAHAEGYTASSIIELAVGRFLDELEVKRGSSYPPVPKKRPI